MPMEPTKFIIYNKWLPQNKLIPWNIQLPNNNLILLIQYYIHKQHLHYTSIINTNSL
jgi:hypothetical protein